MHINTPEVRAGIYDKNLRTKPALPGLMRINLEVQKREASKEFMDYILKLRKNFKGGNISRILDSEPGVCTFEGSTLIYHFTNDPGFVLFLDMHKAKNIKGFEIDNPDLQFVQIIMEPHGALQSAGSMNIMIYPGSKEGVKKLKKSAEEAKKNKDSPNEHAGKIVFIAQQSVETLKPSSAVVDDGWN